MRLFRNAFRRRRDRIAMAPVIVLLAGALLVQCQCLALMATAMDCAAGNLPASGAAELQRDAHMDGCAMRQPGRTSIPAGTPRCCIAAQATASFLRTGLRAHAGPFAEHLLPHGASDVSLAAASGAAQRMGALNAPNDARSTLTPYLRV